MSNTERNEQIYAVPALVYWRAASAEEAQADVTEYLDWAHQVIERESYEDFSVGIANTP